jgi:hypothetical protein
MSLAGAQHGQNEQLDRFEREELVRIALSPWVRSH